MPWRKWGIPDEVGWLIVLLAVAVGPVFLVAGVTTVEWAASSNYRYPPWQGEFQPYPTPVPPARVETAQLVVAVEGDGQVQYTPPGQFCLSGQRCASQHPQGGRLTLVAAAGPGARFQGWEGDCAELAAQPSGVLVVDRNRSCVARFVPAGGPPGSGVTGPGAAPVFPVTVAPIVPTRPTPSLVPTATARPTPTATPLPTATLGPRVELPPQGCDAESTLRSTEGTVVTSVGFTNGSRIPVRVYWLNYSGQRQLYRTLPTTAHYVQDTWATHPWVVTDLEGRCLAVYTAIAQPGSVSLK